MKILVISLLAGAWFNTDPAIVDTLNLDYCYDRIENHYPLARKMELQERITDLRLELAQTGYYPQIDLGGRASYQSEVTKFPTAGSGGASFPALSKDQYRVTLDVTQPIYTGGRVGVRKNIEREKSRQEILATEVQLHEIREQVNEVYFGILLARQRSSTLSLLLENLTSQLETVRARIKNGVLLPSQQYILQAELARIQQDSIEVRSDIRSGIRVLGELIGQQVDVDAVLKVPNLKLQALAEADVQRPEWLLFDSSSDLLDFRKELVNSEKLPVVSAFGLLSYGRPGYNFFNNDFHEFYMVGASVQWNFWGWNNSDEEKSILTIQQQQIQEDRQGFNRQLQMALLRIQEEIQSLQDQIDRDKEIIDLRKRIVEESESQLKNGVITATEYVTELNRAGEAQLALSARRIQLARMLVQYATTKGLSVSKYDESVSTKNSEK